MILKNFQVKSALRYIDQLLSTPLPFKAKLAVSRNKKELVEVMEVIETASNDLLKSCAELDESGNFVHPKDEEGTELKTQVTISKDRVEEFNTKMSDINNTECELNIIQIEVTEDVEAALSCLVNFDPTPILWLFKEE